MLSILLTAVLLVVVLVIGLLFILFLRFAGQRQEAGDKIAMEWERKTREEAFYSLDVPGEEEVSAPGMTHPEGAQG